MPSEYDRYSTTPSPYADPFANQPHAVATVERPGALTEDQPGWLSFRPDDAPPSDAGFRGAQGEGKGRMVAAAAALLAVGALCGALVTSALRGTSSTTASGMGGFGGGGVTGQGGPGGIPGTAANAIAGTLTAVTASSITLKTTATTGTAGATTTYAVSSATRIRSGTATVALSTLQVGDAVSVTPATASATSTTPTASMIIVGTAAAGGTGTAPTGGTGMGTAPTGAGGMGGGQPPVA